MGIPELLAVAIGLLAGVYTNKKLNRYRQLRQQRRLRGQMQEFAGTWNAWFEAVGSPERVELHSIDFDASPQGAVRFQVRGVSLGDSRFNKFISDILHILYSGESGSREMPAVIFEEI